MTKLYEIDEALRKLFDSIIESDDESEKIELKRLADELQTERDKKLSGICSWLINLNSDIEEYAREIARLRDNKKRLENKVESIKLFLTNAIGAGTKWSHGLRSIGWRKSTRLEVDPSAPTNPMFTKIVYEHDLKAIRECLESGGNLDFARLVTNNNIQVK